MSIILAIASVIVLGIVVLFLVACGERLGQAKRR
jgi:hypothetical protein